MRGVSRMVLFCSQPSAHVRHLDGAIYHWPAAVGEVAGVEGCAMISISKSQTADTRTCDFANTTKATLLASSCQHIGDVSQAMAFFTGYLCRAAAIHDFDKIGELDWFHKDFVTGFKQTGWWDNHRKIHRHHLNVDDGVPKDVNLLDVLEHIADCVMAGMARSGSVYPIELDDILLARAFQNTVTLLQSQVVVKP